MALAQGFYAVVSQEMQMTCATTSLIDRGILSSSMEFGGT
jgi:hypothetical protein